MKYRFITFALLVPILVFAQEPQKPNPNSGLDAALTSQQIAHAMVQVKHEKYLHRVLVAFDQFAGAVAGRQDDQTISSAVEISAHESGLVHVPAKVLNGGLDILQHSHGQKAQSGDLERCSELVATDATALTVETGVKVIPTITGAKLGNVEVSNVDRKTVEVIHSK